MKNSDIAAIILIAAISMLAAYFVADSLLGRPSAESVKVKTVDKISSEVQAPDESVFNKEAINPTVQVVIGEGSSKQQTTAANEQSTDADKNTSSSNTGTRQ